MTLRYGVGFVLLVKILSYTVHENGPLWYSCMYLGEDSPRYYQCMKLKDVNSMIGAVRTCLYLSTHIL